MTPPRYIVQNQLAFVTFGAVGRGFRFLPSRGVVDLIWYVLAVMIQRYSMQLHEVVFMSSHFQLMLTDRDGVLPDFMREGTEEELGEWIETVRIVPHPNWTALVYYDSRELSPEEMVEKALAYRPTPCEPEKRQKVTPAQKEVQRALAGRSARVFLSENPRVWYDQLRQDSARDSRQFESRKGWGSSARLRVTSSGSRAICFSESSGSRYRTDGGAETRR